MFLLTSLLVLCCSVSSALHAKKSWQLQSPVDEKVALWNQVQSVRVYHDPSQHRFLQEGLFACPLESVYAGLCTLDEYCAELNAFDDSTTTQCTGDVATGLEVRTTDPEFCVYTSGDVIDFGPYDPDLYVPGIDLCVTFETAMSLFDGGISQFEDTAYFERAPVIGVLSEYFSMSRCDTTYEGQLLLGHCQSCSRVEINGEICNGCETCEFDLARKSVDCSNLSPRLSETCDATADDDDFFISTVLYFSDQCDFFRAVVTQDCSLQDYCDALLANAVNLESASCFGDVAGEWSVVVKGPEQCFYEPNDPLAPGSPYVESLFNAALGHYCVLEDAVYTFDAAVPLAEDITLTVTRPDSKMGSLEYYSVMEDCAFPNTPWGACVEDCPSELYIGGQECTSGCITCDDGFSSWTCTNLDASLIEPCADYEGASSSLLDYLESQNS